MTRIIAGEYRGRRLHVPEGKDIRPTTDRMRERLFSMLGHARYPTLAGARVADIFAGTGALGLEALSRGAAHATFIDSAAASLDCLRKNIAALGANEAATVMRANAPQIGAATYPYDIVFMDPPYRMQLVEPTLQYLATTKWLAADNVIVCEMASDEPLPTLDDFSIIDERSQGQQRMLFLRYDKP